MPELPEVETIAQDLRHANIIGCTISKVHVYWPKTVSKPAVLQFIEHLEGQKITGIQRRAKYLVLQLADNSFVFIHFRMTGRFLISSSDTPVHSPYIRLTVELDNGKSLYFHDTRKFGRWSWTADPKEITAKLGPEPLESSFTLEAFKLLVKGKKRALKPLLLDQQFIAGLGNIYVDEALWEAKLHPSQLAFKLSELQLKALHQAIPRVLKRGLQSQGTTLGSGRTNFYRLNGTKGDHQSLLKVFRRTGEACPRCGEIIQRIVVAQRSTHFCPSCQILDD